MDAYIMLIVENLGCVAGVEMEGNDRAKQVSVTRDRWAWG